MSDVLVIGSGIIGSALAYRLALAGAYVTVVNANDRVATTSTSFAWTNSNQKEPFAYFALNVAGMGEHLALETELGDAPFWHRIGNVEWAVGAEERETLLKKIARLQSWAYPAEEIDRTALRALDPALAAPESADAIAFYPSEGYVDAVPLAETLLERAKGMGATVRTGATVASLGTIKGRMRNVTLANGETLSARQVVCAVGRWSGALLSTVGFDLPMAPTRSCLATTGPVEVRLRTMVFSTAINIRPAGSGKLLLQNTTTDLKGAAESQTIPPERFEDALLAPARRVVRGLGNVRIEDAKLGIRSIPGDGLPVVGPVPGCEALYVVCSHSGVTLAPFFARAVARELIAGKAEERLAPFRPDRFSTLRELSPER